MFITEFVIFSVNATIIVTVTIIIIIIISISSTSNSRHNNIKTNPTSPELRKLYTYIYSV